MKISSHQFLKAFLVGAGLIAVLFAYRSSSKNAASKGLFFADSVSYTHLTLPTKA